MLSVLMIDDEPDVIATVRDHLVATDPAIMFEGETDFNGGLQRLQNTRPDVLILDWFEGDPATGTPAGEAIWTAVWAQWFCPIVIYTAGHVDPFPEHPFIRMVAKGAMTEQTVMQHITSYSPHIDTLRGVSRDLASVVSQVLRHLAPMLFVAEQDKQKRAEILTRAARRRIAAMIDDVTVVGGEPSHAWEQYVFPVLTAHSVAGDIVRAIDSDATDPPSYRVIITPTCDMVPQGAAGICKVTHVLAARCTDPRQYAVKGMGLAANTNATKVRERLPTALNETHQAGFVLLPECPGTLPMMAVNLRELELIPVASIKDQPGEGVSFIRVASLDSPFREQFVWAYLQIGCRPGLPPRSMQSLIDAYINVWNL